MSSHVKSAARVLDLLEVLSSEPDGLTFTELLRRLHWPKSSLHALLLVLAERHYIELDADEESWSDRAADRCDHLDQEPRTVLQRAPQSSSRRLASGLRN